MIYFIFLFLLTSKTSTEFLQGIQALTQSNLITSETSDEIFKFWENSPQEKKEEILEEWNLKIEEENSRLFPLDVKSK